MTFEKHFKSSLNRLFKFSKFRTEKHFLNAYTEHVYLECDSVSFTKESNGDFKFVVDFGDIKVVSMVHTRKSDDYYLITSID